jgi:hypothetical protein
MSTSTARLINAALPRPIVLLSVVAAAGLCGYALLNLIAMPAVSPGVFVPKSLAGSKGHAWFGALQVISVLAFAFALLPVAVMLTVRKYTVHPQAMVIAGVLLCLALLLEIDNNLPVLGAVLYPEPLAPVPDDIALRLRQAAAIRYLSFDVAGFSILYASLLIYSAVFWKTNRLLGALNVASVLTFTLSAPFLWISGIVAVVLLVIAVLAVVPVPVILGRLASARHVTP